MFELVKHIEILLLDNDCVIVPELGGFIAHYQPAHYEEAEGVFLPPIRTVGFNPQLTMNDGMLAQAYMQTYHTDFPDAVRKIAEKVEELKEQLYKEGVMEMPGIGVLHYTIHDTYEFHPNESGILSPSLYALDAFTMKPLAMEMVEEPAPMTVVTHPATEEPLPAPKMKEFRLNPQWLGHAVAVAIAAVLFFALSVPVENTYVDKGVYASLGTDCLFEAIRSHSMVTTLNTQAGDVSAVEQKTTQVVPVTVKVEKVAPAVKPVVVSAKVETPEVKEAPSTKPVVKATEAKAAPKVTPKVATPKVEVKKEVAVAKPAKAVQAKKGNKKQYHLIVASLATSADAQRMLKEYKQQGYPNAVVKESNGRFRISLCSYADKSAAYQKLNELKKADAFKGAWMLTSK